MAKKKKFQPTAPPMTRGQLSRAARERRQLRILYTSVGAVIALIVLILGSSAFAAFVLRPNEEVATVNGEKITRATYEKVRRYDLYQSDESQQILQSQGSSQSTTTTDLVSQLKGVS